MVSSNSNSTSASTASSSTTTSGVEPVRKDNPLRITRTPSSVSKTRASAKSASPTSTSSSSSSSNNNSDGNGTNKSTTTTTTTTSNTHGAIVTNPSKSAVATGIGLAAPLSSLTARTNTITPPVSVSKRPYHEYEFEFVVNSAPDGQQMEEEQRGEKRSRASCDYCRHRHWRCDNKKPTCSHCLAMGQVCTYLNPRKKRGRIPKTANIALNEAKQKAAQQLLQQQGQQPQQLSSSSSSAGPSGTTTSNGDSTTDMSWAPNDLTGPAQTLTSFLSDPNFGLQTLSTSSSLRTSATRPFLNYSIGPFDVPSSPLWLLPPEPASPGLQSFESLFGLNTSGEKHPFRLSNSGERGFRGFGGSSDRNPWRFSGLGISGERGFGFRRAAVPADNNLNQHPPQQTPQPQPQQQQQQQPPQVVQQTPSQPPPQQGDGLPTLSPLSERPSSVAQSPAVQTPNVNAAYSDSTLSIDNIIEELKGVTGITFEDTSNYQSFASPAQFLNNYQKYMGIILQNAELAPLEVLARNVHAENKEAPTKTDAMEISLCMAIAFGARMVTGASNCFEYCNRANFILNICASYFLQLPSFKDTHPSNEMVDFVRSLGEAIFLCQHYWLNCNQFDFIRDYQPFTIRLWNELSFLYQTKGYDPSIGRVLIRLGGQQQLLSGYNVDTETADILFNYALSIPASPIDWIFLYFFRLMASINGMNQKKSLMNDDPNYHLKEALFCTEKLQEALEDWEEANQNNKDDTTNWFDGTFEFCINAAKSLIYHKLGMPRQSSKHQSSAYLQLKTPSFNYMFTEACASVAFLFTTHLEKKEYLLVIDLMNSFHHVAEKYPALKTQFTLVREILQKIDSKSGSSSLSSSLSSSMPTINSTTMVGSSLSSSNAAKRHHHLVHLTIPE